MGFHLGGVAGYLSANQGLGVAAYVAGLMLVWLAGFLAAAWLYGRWEVVWRRRERGVLSRGRRGHALAL